MRIATCALVLCFTSAACQHSQTIAPRTLVVSGIPGVPSDNVCLAKRMEVSASAHRGGIGRARSWGRWTGALTTGLGALTTAAVAAFTQSRTKTGIGLSVGAITTTLGVFQFAKSTSIDPSGYVASTDQAVAQFLAASQSSDKQKAVADLYKAAADLKVKFPEYADFELIDPTDDECSGTTFDQLRAQGVDTTVLKHQR